MSVHYKFKSTLDYDTITFDGLHISVADLKKAILQQKRLSKITDFDLQIINAQTKEEYQHESSLIPKNTSLIISRVPVANQTKKSWDASNRPVQPRMLSKVESADFDLSKMEGSEEDKIQAMMLQSTAEYDPKSYQKIRGYSQTGEVPSTYRCNKCKKGGHWIKNCPYTISKEHTVEKRTTGIPKSFRDKDDRALMIENQEAVVEEDKKQEIPEDLICSICNDLFVDAVMIPCCGSSFCDDCVRTALLESEDNECPDCKEKGSSPGSLIPNRFLRNSVNAFKNRTGYKASSQVKKELNQQSKEAVEEKNVENLNENESKTNETPAPKNEDPDTDPEGKTSGESECKEKEDANDNSLPSEIQPIEEPSGESSNGNAEVKHNTANIPNSPAHEDSDYEDNIVVTVPSASETRTEKYLTRRHGSHPKPPGIEQTSPKPKNQVSPYYQESNANKSSDASSHSAKEWDHSSREKVREQHEIANNDHYMYEKNSRTMASTKSIDNVQPPGANPLPIYPAHPTYDMQQQPRPIRPMNMHMGFHSHMHRPPLYPHPNMPPHHPPHQMRLPMPPINSYDPTYNPIGNVAPGYQRFPTAMPNRFNYPIRESEVPNQMRPFNNIASVYEEVAAKVGVGIIDDPLEAFNRIMKEKEKKKDERRSPDRRRRSKERHIRGNFRTSPYNNRTKDHGYHDKRGRSRERDNDRRWPRYGKAVDKDRERERERDRDRERDREREKDQCYRTRRSKSLDRSSRSRSHSPPVKRYRSPQNCKPHSAHDKHQHHYNPKVRLDEQQEEGFERQKRDSGRTLSNPSKILDYRCGSKQHTDHEEKNITLRRTYNINDENSEPPPPGFELQPTRNPFHSNNAASPEAAIRERERPPRNNTPDLYEKCVSQDMEDNKLYNISGKTDQRSRSKSPSRSRSRSRSSLKLSEKRRKIHRSTTPKGTPSDGHIVKRDKENTLTSRSHSDNKRKSEERCSKKDKELNDHEPKRRSMTPPRQKDMIGVQHPTSSDIDHKERSESKKSDKKIKERKKKRREKSERKKIKKEKKSKKERHRPKSEEKDGMSNENDKNDDLNTSASIVDNNEEQSNKLEEHFQKHTENMEEEGEYHSIEKELATNSTPQAEQNGSVAAQCESTPKNQQHPTNEYEEKTPTSSDIKCFDAVLDIHEYETDFDDNSFKLQESANKLVPEASKWELEDQFGTPNQNSDTKTTDSSHTQNHADNKVTNDVIVRAEKAIFARAINAIRPLEVRKKSVSKERSAKSYNDDHESIQNIQITLPVNISKDRSIEVKPENNEKKKSIKERLGSKISQPIYSQVADTRRDSDHGYKSGYINNERDPDSDRDRRKKGPADIKGSSSKKNEIDKNYRERFGRERERERDRSREGDKSRDKEKERDRERDKGKERARHRERDNVNKDRDHDKDRNRERTRDGRHGHELNNERNKHHSKSRDHKILKSDKLHNSSEREREYVNTSRKRHYSNSPSAAQRRRSPSSSNSDLDDDDRKRKYAKSDRKSHKRSESLDSDGGKRSSKKKNKSDKKKKKKSKK